MNETTPRNHERKLWHDGPNHTADAVIIDEISQKILLIKRRDCGEWALPGGFVDPSDASPFDSAKREACEEASIELGEYDPVLVYQGIVDDPRNTASAWIETSAYRFTVDAATRVAAGDDASEARWFALDALPNLYASHSDIIARAVNPSS